MSPRIRRIFFFDENSLNSTATSWESPSQSMTVITDYSFQLSDAQGSCNGVFEDHPGRNSFKERVAKLPSYAREKLKELLIKNGHEDAVVALEAFHAASPSLLPPSVPPSSDDEEVNLYLKITKTVALKARRNSTVEDIKAFIQDKEQIDEHSQQVFFGGNRLQDGKRLIDYGIHGHPTLHVILQDSARMRVKVEILSTQKSLLVEPRHQDTIQDVKVMIQDKEGIPPHEFDLVFSGKVLAVDRTLASLDLLQEPTFHLVFHPKDDVSVIIDMSNCRVTVGAKFWYTVRDVKAIVGAMMSAQVMSLHMIYQGKQLEDDTTLACYNIADGSVLQLVSPYAPFPIFVKCKNGKTVALQVCSTDTVKEVKNKLLHKLQVSVPAKLHAIAYVGKRLADDRDLASYGIQENSTLFEIITPRSK
ncbi:uncharacterized protein LOC115683580 [Syzygium oleosum]|uniref:uncharacterized protein LOC115683580 n=1 Tax=Syzygium oleosum TaxID=219896 RepID=UPI0011D2A380|nr:uncharacterized protein LOC115683580 [Syzygium oleosum]